ncbi:hypothetical protein [Allorhodopirellula solitaria]|uniref:hypothetical protein n=1 Tax=Allorhodopirellula solitaria TaxID=2527987 RepID=UPI0011B7CD0B|nr:hypothetical protein [Allorhodopirellula solitaria]
MPVILNFCRNQKRNLSHTHVLEKAAVTNQRRVIVNQSDARGKCSRALPQRETDNPTSAA